MTYQETTDWLFAQLPVYQRQGKTAMKKDLTNIRALLDFLGNPHEKLRCVHVGGTNGKGTTAHLIAAGLQAGGKQVGLYTSPHYVDFRERIKINGTFISEGAVVTGVEAMQDIIKEIQPSFFELTVALAFDYFARQKVDWAVIEVGLGGRLDSTNVITPALSVITNISKDHTQFLGDTLPQIAYEKAGIIKAGIPVVIGETQAETKPVFINKALEVNASISFADQFYQAELSASENDLFCYRVLDLLSNRPVKPDFCFESNAPHLHLNLVTALAALHQLHAGDNNYQLAYDELASQWVHLQEHTKFINRFYKIGKSPIIYVDSGHNAGGLVASMEYLKQRLQQSPATKLHIVIGVVSDKDLASILPLSQRMRLTTLCKHPFCAPCQQVN